MEKRKNKLDEKSLKAGIEGTQIERFSFLFIFTIFYTSMNFVEHVILNF
jgi:hypothetical protein